MKNKKSIRGYLCKNILMGLTLVLLSPHALSRLTTPTCGFLFNKNQKSKNGQILKKNTQKYPEYNLTQRLEFLLKENANNGHYKKRSQDRWIKTSSGASVRFEVLLPIHINTKETLLFFGGLGYEVERFWKNSSFFNSLRKKGYKIVFIEMPGQGETLVRERVESQDRETLSYPVEQQKHVALSAIETLQNQRHLPKKFHVAGLSYGGWILTTFIKDPFFSSQLKSLTLLSTGVQSLHKLNNPIAQSYLSDSWLWLIGKSRFYQKVFIELITDYINNELPHLKNDPLKVHGSSALTLGIYLEDALRNLSSAPSHLKINALLASSDEVVPGSMHWDLAQLIAKMAPDNRVIVATPGEHDLLAEKKNRAQKGLLALLEDPELSQWSVVTSDQKRPFSVSPEAIRQLLKED